MSEVPIVEKRSVATLERHVQTAMIAVITSSIFFVANYIYNDNRQKAVDQSQLQVLTTQVIELRTDVRAMQNNFVRREEFNEVKDRMKDFERRKQ